MSKENTSGIHHITAITADPQKNLDFYEGFLGQRLVKKTLNYDDPHAYHLYYADSIGTFGTLLTFFYWKGMPKRTIGKGEVSEFFYAIPKGSSSFWKSRAEKFGIVHKEDEIPFFNKALIVYDPDGIKINLIEIEESPKIKYWKEGSIAKDYALLGFYGAKITVDKKEYIESTLTKGLGFEEIQNNENLALFKAVAGDLGQYIVVEESPDTTPAYQGTGSVHHIAFQTKNDRTLKNLMKQIHDLRIPTTEIVDRQYFHAVYFRTHAGILFELSTNDIGLTVDGEKEKDLGENLIIPPHYKEYKDEIERVVIPLKLPRHEEKWKQ